MVYNPTCAQDLINHSLIIWKAVVRWGYIFEIIIAEGVEYFFIWNYYGGEGIIFDNIPLGHNKRLVP